MPAARPLSRLALVLAALCAGGCATTYDVEVDAISRPKAPEAVSYRIKNLNPAVEEDALRYKEATNYVKAALSGKGMYEAAGDEPADVIVELEYGVAPPTVRMEEVTVPIYEQRGGGVIYDTQPVADRLGNVTMRTVPVYQPPRQDFVRYETQTVPVAIYEKFLRISARENKPVTDGRNPEEIWSVNTSVEDRSKDLRRYLPILASASMESIGSNTGKLKTVRLKADDENVDFVKKGL